MPSELGNKETLPSRCVAHTESFISCGCGNLFYMIVLKYYEQICGNDGIYDRNQPMSVIKKTERSHFTSSG